MFSQGQNYSINTIQVLLNVGIVFDFNLYMLLFILISFQFSQFWKVIVVSIVTEPDDSSWPEVMERKWTGVVAIGVLFLLYIAQNISFTEYYPVKRHKFEPRTKGK